MKGDNCAKYSRVHSIERNDIFWNRRVSVVK